MIQAEIVKAADYCWYLECWDNNGDFIRGPFDSKYDARQYAWDHRYNIEGGAE